MTQAIIVKGRLVDSRHVELDQPLDQDTGEVEVIVRDGRNESAAPRRSLADFIRSLPPGNRTMEDIVQQVREERDSWGDR